MPVSLLIFKFASRYSYFVIKKIKNYFARYNFLQEFAKVNRHRAVVNLNEAKTIGVVYAVNSEETYKIVETFVKSLKTKDRYIHILGYIPVKYFPPYIIPTLATDYFTGKDINWFGKPVNAYVTDFLKREFDIIINLCMEDNYTLQYICGLSKASFKVGISGEGNTDYYDFMIEAKAGLPVEDFIKEIIHYLTIINTKND